MRVQHFKRRLQCELHTDWAILSCFSACRVRGEAVVCRHSTAVPCLLACHAHRRSHTGSHTYAPWLAAHTEHRRTSSCQQLNAHNSCCCCNNVARSCKTRERKYQLYIVWVNLYSSTLLSCLPHVTTPTPLPPSHLLLPLSSLIWTKRKLENYNAQNGSWKLLNFVGTSVRIWIGAFWCRAHPI